MKYIYESPIGKILLEGTDEFLTGLNFINEENVLVDNEITGEVKKTVDELEQYFSGELKNFSIKTKVSGTVFREKVWNELKKIPYGEVISYKKLAVNIGNEKAVRAVGGANHHNNISIIIPCHRVCGNNGSLVGYGGELWRKEWLLEHEKRNV